MDIFSAEKRQQKLQERIEQVSSNVAGLVLSRLSLQRSPDDGLAFRRYSIGKKPRGIDVEDYIEQVQAKMFRKLFSAGVNDAVHFDEEATLTASTRLIEVEPGYSERIARRDGLVLVLTEPPTTT